MNKAFQKVLHSQTPALYRPREEKQFNDRISIKYKIDDSNLSIVAQK